FASEPHDVVTAVNVNSLPRHRAGEVAGEEESEAAHFQLVDIALERSTVSGHLQHVAEGADASGSKGFDWARGDGVDADIFWPEAGSQIPNAGLERGLGKCHHVIVQ